jgi:hypothetical protein
MADCLPFSLSPLHPFTLHPIPSHRHPVRPCDLPIPPQAPDNLSAVLPARPAQTGLSEFRIEKTRIHAFVNLSTGESIEGCFFVAGASAQGSVPERVAEILNAEDGLFPFEVHDQGAARTVLYNRTQIVTVSLTDPEARRDPGYDVATPRDVSVQLSDGRRLEGRDRLSDWARDADRFRYLEVGDTTVIINVAHVIELSEDGAR